MGEHIYTFIDPTSTKHLEKACRILENDGIIAYPTDVNWALGCHSQSPKGLKKLQAMKPDHPKDRPFSLICSSFSMMSLVGILENGVYGQLKRLLPGPYTILLKRAATLPKLIKDKRPIAGVRFPKAPLLIDLVQTLGSPLLTTSLPSHPNPVEFGYEIQEIWGHALGLILDLGQQIPTGGETEILDGTSGDELVLVRKGSFIEGLAP